MCECFIWSQIFKSCQIQYILVFVYLNNQIICQSMDLVCFLSLQNTVIFMNSVSSADLHTGILYVWSKSLAVYISIGLQYGPAPSGLDLKRLSYYLQEGSSVLHLCVLLFSATRACKWRLYSQDRAAGQEARELANLNQPSISPGAHLFCIMMSDVL